MVAQENACRKPMSCARHCNARWKSLPQGGRSCSTSLSTLRRQMSTTDLITAAANDLARRIDSTQVHVPNGAPLIWNAAVQHRPALIVRAESSRDVQEAIRVARDRGMRLSVLGGGHDWAGRAVCDGGLVIDLSGMRRVTVETQARVATVGGAPQRPT
jgi:hypothetical protein